MDYEAKPTMKADVMGLLRLICIDFYQLKIIRIAVYLTLMGTIFLQLLQTYVFLIKFDIRYFIKYSLIYIGGNLVLLSTITILHMGEVAAKIFKEIQLWEIDCASKTIESKIKRESKTISVVFIFCLVLTEASAILHVIPKSDDREMCYVFIFFEEYFPEWYHILSWGFRTTFIMVALIMIVPFWQIIYYCNHLKFQSYLLMYYLENIDESFEAIDEDRLFYNEDYQKEIKKRLSFCLVRHVELHIQGNKIVNTIKYLIILFAVTGCVLTLSLLFFVLWFQNMLPGRFLRIATMGLATALLSTYLIQTGQDVEDVSWEFFEALKKSKWYHWNGENKKTYLVFLLNAQKLFRLAFSEKTSINYQLVVAVLKPVYSLLSILCQLKEFQF